MEARVLKFIDRRFVMRGCALLLCIFSSVPAWAACPKLLMSAGLNIWKQTNPKDAAYWGRKVGLQGFLVNYVVTDWQTDVGTNQDKGTWKAVRRFQSIYSRYGVTDNFLKIGLFKAHDWNSAKQNRKVVTNLGHAAALAKYAGFIGVALDLEPYKPTWGGSAGGPDLAKKVEKEGREIGKAMHDAYPGMTLMILPDVMREVEHEKTQSSDWAAKHHGGYGLSVPFVRGLLSVPWSHVVMATEFTYSAHADRIAPSVHEAAERYSKLGSDGGARTNFSVAPGLWPLGPSKNNKSARETPEQFKRRLQKAFEVSKQYVWIFGSNSAWQKDGPLGPVPGPVAPNFQQFVDAIHQVRASCGADIPASAQSPESSPQSTASVRR